MIGSVVVDGVAYVMWLPSSSLLVVGDMSARVDWLSIGGNHLALRAWLVGGVCGAESLLLPRWRTVVDIGDGALGSVSSSR
jgi:hypothetical protein